MSDTLTSMRATGMGKLRACTAAVASGAGEPDSAEPGGCLAAHKSVPP